MFAAFLAAAAAPAARESTVLFHEDFDTLENWKPFAFPGIPKHTVYSIERDGSRSFLRAESSASASAIVYKDRFNAVKFPRARWRWKISNVYTNANPRTKAGDDYPIRINVTFEYDPASAGAADRLIHGLGKMKYGEDMPMRCLSYAWSSGDARERIFSSPYMDNTKMVILRTGAKDADVWVEEGVNILEDYRKAFGGDPPSRARIDIMNDSDNTGERSVSWVDYIEVYK